MNKERTFNFALNVDEDGRILSATFPQYASAESKLVYELPEGDITEYIYNENEDGYSYIHDPITVEIHEEPTQLDRIEAQTLYTALLTNSLLEV